MLDDPLLLVFVDMELWDVDKEEAGHQRDFIDGVHKDLYFKARAKVVTVIVPIDNTKSGNGHIYDLFGLNDR